VFSVLQSSFSGLLCVCVSLLRKIGYVFVLVFITIIPESILIF